MLINKIGSNWYKISAFVPYTGYVEQTYMYYTKKEAVKLFKEKTEIGELIRQYNEELSY